MKVTVKWIVSPRAKYGIPRAPGTFSEIDASLAKKIEKESPGMFEEIEKEKPVKVKDTQAKKPYTRPVKRESKY